jgi:putative nucleotidyltransferase with HDIG domain
MQTLDDYINQIKTLPPAPRVLWQLLVLLNDVDSHAGQIVELIALDPALTAKVLQRCNNAASGLSRPISDLDQAVALEGFNAIYRLVAAVVGESILSSGLPGYGIGAGQLWEHSVTTAVAARVVARQLGGVENLAFTAALLHDIGKLVLGAFLEGPSQSVLKETGLSGRSFIEAEKALLGVNHAEIGGRVLARWNFPANLVGAVWHHHNPAEAGPHGQLAACVHLGDIIAHCLGQAHGYESFALHPRADALQILGISPNEIDTLVIETDAALQQYTGLNRITA